MTSRQLYDGVLIELNKENAPNLLLEDFNYFANKAVNQYINKRYNIYDVNQQTTDDLRVLKATSILPVNHSNEYNDLTTVNLSSYGYNGNMATYYVDMPSDYLHLLNCICIYTVEKTYKCYNKGDTWRSPAIRLTADMYSLVLDNFWNKPTYKKPYYYIHNVNVNLNVPTYPSSEIGDASGNLDNGGSDVTGNIEGVTVSYEIVGSTSGRIKIMNKSNDSVLWNIENETLPSWASTDSLGGAVESGKLGYINLDLSENTSSSARIKTVTITIEEEPYLVTISQQGRTGSSSDMGTDCQIIGGYGTDGNGNQIVQGVKIHRSINIDGKSVSNVERGQGIRYGNVSKVRLEIRYGTDDSIFKLSKVYIDYIKTPLHIRLTQFEIDRTEDTSQMLEFPDYVCQEILNELVHIVMENIQDQRLQTHPVVSLSIANPTQALTPEAAG